MGTLVDLATRVDKLAQRITVEGPKPANAAALAMVRYLAHNTPVDTSRAQSNWQISLGVPFRFELPPYVPGKFGSNEAVNAEEVIKSAEYILSHRKVGTPIFLSNSAPYIVKLNNGSSRQGFHFVEAAIAVGKQTVQSIRRIA